MNSFWRSPSRRPERRLDERDATVKKRIMYSGMAVLILQPSAQALDYHGSNTLRLSEYQSEGPGSPYPIEGSMAYDEFALYLREYTNAYDFYSAQITGVYAADDYRHPENGISAERVNLTAQRGTGSLPYRAELGDHFAYYSQLTLQQSLKGGQLELQPFTGFGQHSIVINIGEIESDWRRLNAGENSVAGLSWLIEQGELGSFALNVVHNEREGFAALGSLDRSQTVYSLSGEKQFLFAAHRLSIESELAHFSGDHDGTVGAASGQSRSDNAVFVELRGAPHTGRWDVRLRGDHFGQDYRPVGAIVSADRRSVQAFGGYRFRGSQLRGRIQRFKDNYETNNLLTSETTGVNLSGAYLPGMNTALDIFRQTLENQAGTVDQNNLTGTLDLSRSLRHNLQGRASAFYQHTDDRTAVNADSRTRQLGVFIDYSFAVNGFSGLLSPGVLWREIREVPVESDELQPTLRLRLSRYDHRLELQYNGLRQDRSRVQGGVDVDTVQWSANYHYRRGQHVFGAEFDRFDRKPDVGTDTEAYRASLYWTFHFDHRGDPTANLAVGTSSATESSAIDILALTPGSDPADINSALADQNLTRPEQQGAFQAYAYPVFYDINLSQTLVTEQRDAQLQAAAVVIRFDDRGDAVSMAQAYADTLRQLIRQYGRPTRNFETGDFSGNLNSQLANGRFKRIVEWDMPKGVLRFGIPRRLDGDVRMELIYRQQQPETNQSLWGLTQYQ